MGFSILTDRERTGVEREIRKYGNIGVEKIVETSSTAGSNSSRVKKSTFSTINAFLESVGHELHIQQEKSTTISDEFRRYRFLVSKLGYSSSEDSSPLQFWSKHGTSLPILSVHARRFLATPGTSVPSETAFSMSSFINRKERCRLTPQNLSSTMFLRDKLI